MPPVSRTPRTDGESTRTRILEAAGALFADAGFGQTTSKAVAARAQVDLASINYHFGSRDGLYQAVLIEAHRRLMDLADLQSLVQRRVPAADKFKLLMDGLVGKALQTGEDWHLSVLATAILAPTPHVAALLRAEVQPKLALVLPVLAEISGIPIDDPALWPCFMSVAAPCLVLLISRRGLPGPLQQVRQMPQQALSDHLHCFAVAGLEAVGQAHRQNKVHCPRIG